MCSRLEYPVEGWLGLDLRAIDIESKGFTKLSISKERTIVFIYNNRD